MKAIVKRLLPRVRNQARTRLMRMNAGMKVFLAQTLEGFARRLVRFSVRLRKKDRLEAGGQGRLAIRQINDLVFETHRVNITRLRPIVIDPKQILVPKGFQPHRGHDPVGLWQVDFLKEQGVLPEHKVLDIGCGDLREGVPLIRYLDPRCYVGVDQSEAVLHQGALSMGEDDWRKGPRFFKGGDFGFLVIGEEFDWLWAHSVFTHIDLSLVGKCMESAFSVMKSGARFLATFFAAPDVHPWSAVRPYRRAKPKKGILEKSTRGFRNPYHHPVPILSAMAEHIGFQFELFDNMTQFKRQNILQLTKPAGAWGPEEGAFPK